MSVNKIILIGHVGKDPEVRYFDNGRAVASFSLATTEKGYTTANGTLVPDRTEWHNIVLWRGLAETAEKYVHKGSKLYVEGKLRTRNYDDAQGVRRYITEVWGDQMELLGAKQENPNAAAPFPPPSPSVQAPANDSPKAAMETKNEEAVPPLSTDESNDLPF